MSKRRKYEPCGGVVPCLWRTGDPSNSHAVVVELWKVGFTYGEFTPRVSARLTVWVRDWGNNRWLRTDGTPVEESDGKVRRWMLMNLTRTTELSLTVGDWNV